MTFLCGMMTPNTRCPVPAWLFSVQSSAASGHKPEALETATRSLDSSSGSSSLPGQVYAVSENMTGAKDSGVTSPPSVTQPAALNGSLHLNGRCGEKLKRPGQDVSSESDEGCGAWGSLHRKTRPQAQSVNTYEDDSALTSKLRQTLTEFEENLADHEEMVPAKDTPYIMSTNSNEVPVSVVDIDVPVTAIDDVLQDYDCNNEEHEVNSFTNAESSASKEGPDFCQKPNVELQNKNNNAYTTANTADRSHGSAKKLSQLEQHREPPENKWTANKEEGKTINGDANDINGNTQTMAVKSDMDMQKDGKNAKIKKPELPSKSQRSAFTEKDKEILPVNQSNASLSTSHGKITHNVTSRFGLKTFTVVPPKPAVIQAPTTPSAATITTGAIKIDDQGNMVMAGISQNKAGRLAESEDNTVSPLLEKAKTFWNSNERQEKSATPRKALNDKAKESGNALHSTPAAGLEVSSAEHHKTTQSTISKSVERVQVSVTVGKEAKEHAEDGKDVHKEWTEVGSKVSVSKNVQPPSNKPAIPPALLPDLKKDMSFLKPSRRTSSQYVASAITKYAPKTSAKPSSIPKIPDFSASPAPAGLQRPGQSTQQGNLLRSSLSSSADGKENVSTSTSIPPNPKRWMSYPADTSDGQEDGEKENWDRGRSEKIAALNKEGSATLGTAKNNHSQFSESTQIKVAANNNGDYAKHIRPRSPSPAKNNVLQPPSKLLTPHPITSHGLISSLKQTTEDVNQHPPDSSESPGPLVVTVFGPVKKFKPVICRSVEKETSLHSSLMEAIQTGGGRDRLKKISPSNSINLKKGSCVEEENGRSALLAAIRAQSNSSRLKKTKSEASHELEQIRKLTSEREKSPDSLLGPPSLTCSLPVSTPPPPPPMSAALSPPPPALPRGKPNSVAHPNTNAPTDPSLAREAMLEAIRSGSAAGRLKKVSVPTKTVHVNGRNGKIQVQAVSSSNLLQ